MKIKRIQFNRYGEPSQMYMGEYELPKLKGDEVMVQVRAAAINPLDWKQRQGSMKLFMGRKFPKGIGNDFSGTVLSLGENEQDLQIGDEVFGTMDVKNPGAFAERLVTKSRYLTKKPAHISFSEAACLPIPCTTSWAALFGKGEISRNSRVFINGCTGAVGSMAVQLAVANGAYVVGTCGQASMEDARLNGVSQVFNYHDEGYLKGEEPFDLIFDTAGAMNVGRGLTMLKPKGRFIDINPTPKRMIRGMISRRYKLVFATMATQKLPEIAYLAAQGKLRSVIGSETSFAEAIEAITRVEKGSRTKGRAVITF
ncbi:NAD(P)-dependent alcohol dehydrogenase [Fulvivirga ulvae]|uniref:NAD(P)-dependent alcohol dehydrogenase n=1 Tax=Fulvivirga ulvae TaxID=2904245 RepID=UPI001F34EA8B|nr:NAD(P)-dependent alcohol dehydrogenase [Fulvivirga ulvae]UII29601.1 NAD(P)-dependent alcohol dehydrogenase [Fulvivirga ulvae]